MTFALGVLRAHHEDRSQTPWWDMVVLVEHSPRKTIGMRTSGKYPWWVDPELRIAFSPTGDGRYHHFDHWAS